MAANLEASPTKKPSGLALVLMILLLIGGAIVICGGIPAVVGSILFEQVWLMPGDPSRFDPIAAFPAVADFAGRDYQLYRIDIQYVRSDGTLDTYADYYPYVNYYFFREARPANARPIGAGGNAEGVQYEVVEVEISRPGFRRRFTNLGMNRDVQSLTGSKPGSVIRNPQCSLAELWRVALTHDAPESAVAVIRYDANGYHFEIYDTAVDLQFDDECQLVRS
jgi:hypothetical protein